MKDSYEPERPYYEDQYSYAEPPFDPWSSRARSWLPSVNSCNTPTDKLKDLLLSIRINAGSARDSGNPSVMRSLVALVGEIEAALHTLESTYLEDDEEQTRLYDTFKTECFAAIDRARPYLDPLDWKGVLGNLALAILGLGVVYAAAGLIKLAVTGDFLFFRPTDQTDALKENITSVVEPARSRN